MGRWVAFRTDLRHFLPLNALLGHLGHFEDTFKSLFRHFLVTFEHLLELLSDLIGVLIDVDADDVLAGHHGEAEDARVGVVVILLQCCQMAKFDPFLSLDCARVEGVGAQSKERKGSNFAA